MSLRPPELLYAVDERPPPRRLALLGLQYAFLIGIYLIFVVMVGRAASASEEVMRDLVGLGFIAAAAGALAQAWPGQYFGSGYLAPPVFSAVYIGPALLAAHAGGLPAVAGMTVLAGLTEAALSRFIARFRVVFQPSISGFTVLVIGLELGLIGIGETLDVREQGSAVYGPHVAVALVTLAAAIGLSIWGRGVLRLVCTLLGVLAGVLAGVAVGLIDGAALSPVSAAPWFAVPDPSFLSYSVEWALVPAFVAAGFAAALRTVGVVTICQKINDAEWKRPEHASIRRGVLGDAMGTLAAGMLGCPGMCVAPSLVGVSSATGATSRAIAYVAAGFLVAFAFLPKVAAAVVSLPPEITGAVLVFTSSFMIASGIEIMASRALGTRTAFALSIGLLLGLATQVDAGYFRTLPQPWDRVLGDMLTVSLAAAIGLTLVFRLGIRQADSMAWQSAEAAASFGSFLDNEARAWKLGAETAGRAKEAVAELVAHPAEARLLEAPLDIRASYDGLDLLVELRYRGRPPSLGRAEPGHERSHEEAAVAAGLKSFAAASLPDRWSVAAKGEEVTIGLWFSA